MENNNLPKCFVCETALDSAKKQLNTTVFLPVCTSCRGTAAEKQKAEELLDSLADGLVCGCI